MEGRGKAYVGVPGNVALRAWSCRNGVGCISDNTRAAGGRGSAKNVLVGLKVAINIGHGWQWEVHVDCQFHDGPRAVRGCGYILLSRVQL
jgi:hypothetical protein